MKRDGLVPLTLKPSWTDARRPARSERIAISDRRSAELFTSLGQLLSAGADIRSALAMLADRAGSQAATQLCRALLEEVSGGRRLPSLLRHPQREHPHPCPIKGEG